MTPSGPHQTTNRLLSRLPEIDYARLFPSLEVVHLTLGTVIHELGEELRHVYFPIDNIISLLCVMPDGDSAEIAIVGNDGMLGVSLFMSGKTTTSRAVVQSQGYGFRLDAETLMSEFNRRGALYRLLLLYTQALMTQMAQTGACNLHHTVEQHLCRWLLMSLDLLPVNRIAMTQGLIANMLGVRKSGVLDAAGRLQAAGLVRYESGTITVVDRPGLERHACECYSTVKKEFDRLFTASESD
jgi:CRP-like cAMP-binding protein